jgi:hypothetical protein
LTTNNKISDDNRGKGYAILIHDFNGQAIPQAKIGLAIGLDILSQNKSLNFTKDGLYQLSLLENEFLLRPELKKIHRSRYMYALVNTQKEGYEKLLYQELQEMESKPRELRADELAVLRYFYEHLGEKEKAKYYIEKLNSANDDFDIVSSTHLQRIVSEGDPLKKIALFKESEAALPNSQSLVVASIIIGYEYVNMEDYAALQKLVEKYESKIPENNISLYYNNLAKKILEKNNELALAESYSIKAQTKNSPASQEYIYTLGLIKEKQGKHEEAYTAFKAALADKIETSNPKINESYVLSAIKIGKKQEAWVYEKVQV